MTDATTTIDSRAEAASGWVGAGAVAASVSARRPRPQLQYIARNKLDAGGVVKARSVRRLADELARQWGVSVGRTTLLKHAASGRQISHFIVVFRRLACDDAGVPAGPSGRS